MTLLGSATGDCKVVVRAGVEHPAASSPSNQVALMVEEEVLEATAVAGADKMEEARTDFCASSTSTRMCTAMVHRAKILLNVARQRRTRLGRGRRGPTTAYGRLTLTVLNHLKFSTTEFGILL